MFARRRCTQLLTLALIVVLLGGCQQAPSPTPRNSAAAPATPVEGTPLTVASTVASPTRATPTTSAATATRPVLATPTIVPCPAVGQRQPTTASPLPGGAVISPVNIGQLTERNRWGRGAPQALQFSPDGRWLAVSWSGGITLFDACTFEERRSLNRGGALAFSPDSQLLAMSDATTLEVRRVADFSLVYQHPFIGSVYSFRPNLLRFDPAGDILAASSGDQVTLYRANDGQQLRQLDWHYSGITGLVFSPDGATLVTTDAGTIENHQSVSFTIRRWRVADGSLLATVKPPGSGHINPQLSADGSLIMSDNYGKQPILWRFAGDTLTMLGQLPRSYRLALSPANDEVLIVDDSGKLERWRAVGSTRIATIGTYSEVLQLAAYSPDRATIAMLDDDGALHLLRTVDGTPLGGSGGWRVEGPTLLLPDSETLVSSSLRADNRGTLHLWRLADGAPLRTIVTDGGYVMALASSPDGAIIASSGANLTIQLWRTADGTPIGTLEGQTNMSESITFSPDGQFLAVAIGVKKIAVWRVAGGPPLYALDAPDYFGAMRFTPDSQLLLVAAEEGSIRQYNSADGTLVGSFATLPGVFTSPSGFVAGGTRLVTYDRAAIHLWDWANQTLVREFPLTDDIAATAISPDGLLLALARRDGIVTFLRTSDGTIAHRLIIAAPERIRFTPDGTGFLAIGTDGTVRLWGVPR